jgi:ligand-binding SRPBCC domain-containing protein
MPAVESSLILTRPREEVFALFLTPARVLTLAPPELHFHLVEAPERLTLGARVTVRTRRWGLSQHIETAVTALVPGSLLTQSQTRGPLRRYAHTHTFEEVEGGTRLSDHIEFDPPGGILGLKVTASFLEADLRHALTYRNDRLRDWPFGEER